MTNSKKKKKNPYLYQNESPALSMLPIYFVDAR